MPVVPVAFIILVPLVDVPDLLESLVSAVFFVLKDHLDDSATDCQSHRDRRVCRVGEWS